jgi:hypothetical protein
VLTSHQVHESNKFVLLGDYRRPCFCTFCVDNAYNFVKSEPTAIFKRNAGHGSTVEAGGRKHDAQKSVSGGGDVLLTRMLASSLVQVNRHASAVLL